MTLFINTVYTVFMGVFFRSLYYVNVKEEGQAAAAVSVTSLLRRENVFTALPIFLIFVIDWGCFQWAFHTESSALSPLSFRNMTLALFYAPAIFSLCSGALVSLDCTRRYSVFLGAYHLFAFAGELSWVFIGIRSHEARWSSESVSLLVTALVIYFLLRVAMGMAHIQLAENRTDTDMKYIDPIVLTWSSLLLKPVLLLICHSGEIPISNL